MSSYETSPHFQNGRFVFDGKKAPHAMLDIFKVIFDKDRAKWPEWVENAPLPADAPHPEERVFGEKLSVSFINHATFLVQCNGLNILIDPFFSERASPVSWAGPRRMRAPGMTMAELPPIDVVLVSHNHYDHMDLPSLEKLAAQDHPLLITGLGNAYYLTGLDYPVIRELDWWQSTWVKGVTIHYVPANHFSKRGLFEANKALWGGFVIESSAGRLYFAGDTAWGPHFAEIGKRFAPIRVALLPIGAYEPQWFMSASHVNPEEAVHAHLALGARESLAMHYGTIQLSNEAFGAPVDDLENAKRLHNVGGAFDVIDYGATRVFLP